MSARHRRADGTEPSDERRSRHEDPASLDGRWADGRLVERPDPVDEIEVDLAELQSAPGRAVRGGADGPVTQTKPPTPADAAGPRGGDDARAAGPLVADDVGYARGGRQILHSVSLRADPGRTLAVTGPSGSGKSSLLALLAGLEEPDSGHVQAAQAERVGLILQGYGLVSVLTAAENVEIALQAGAGGQLAPDRIRHRAAAALELVGLAPVADHLIEELSGGQQQRVAVARALAIEPTVLLADELTAELDHEWKERVVDAVLAVAARGGIVVVATHDPEIAARCDDNIHLVDGRVVRAESAAGSVGGGTPEPEQ